MRFLFHNEEFEWRRAVPDIPYSRTLAVLRLPKSALEKTVSFLRSYRRLEAACYWYGLRDSAANASVKAVVVPSQRNRRGNYHVPAKSVTTMSNATRPFGWLCLSQVHSHPGLFVEHSLYDDEHASSQKILSVVFPNYGRWNSEWPKGIGIHEFQNGYWHNLSDEDAARRVQIERDVNQISFIDLR